MDEAKPGAASPQPDPPTPWQDWLTLWQSELAHLVADREWQDFQRYIGLLCERFAPAWRAACAHDAAAPGPARPAPAAPSPDAGADAVRELHARVASLESRLAALERPVHHRPDSA